MPIHSAQLPHEAIKNNTANNQQSGEPDVFGHRTVTTPKAGTKARIQLTALILAIAIIVFSLISIFINYVVKSIYRERHTYLSAQTKTTAQLVEKTLMQFDDYASVCARIVTADLTEGTSVTAFMDQLQDKIFLEGARLILVDTTGTWYGENGTSGRITAMDNYTSGTPDHVNYMTTGVDVDIESVVFRVRLPETITATTTTTTTTTGTAEIAYCSVICYMDNLQRLVESEFPFTCNRFIVDTDGFMIYKNFELGVLMPGTNLFSKLDRVDILHGDSVDTIRETIDAREVVVTEFTLDNEDYFYCCAPIDINDWYIAYVIPSSALTIGSYIRYITVVTTAICTAVVLGLGTAIILYAHRIRDRKQLATEQQINKRLQEASHAKSLFLSNMSHDIRTPINGIMGATALAQKENNPPKTTDYLVNIEKASRHLLSLVNDVLDMSSIESGKVVITPAPHNVRDILDDCMVIINGQMQGRQLQVVCDFDNIEHPFLQIDELHTRQILINILSNAVKYTRDGGTITVRASQLPRDDDSCLMHFEVQDTGIGMKPEFIGRIWDQFSQENGGARTKYKGTGLGMSITKKFVELMGGTITVTSEYEVGSLFTVEIPFAYASEPIAAEEEQLASRPIEGCRILLAEDNELNMMIAAELLKDEGAVITPAEDGKIAYDLFVSNPEGSFDILLLDIMMPNMNGLEVTEAIRKLPRPDSATIPIVAMTANAMEEDIKATEAAGMDAHLSKPIDMPTMLKTLSQFYHKESN